MKTVKTEDNRTGNAEIKNDISTEDKKTNGNMVSVKIVDSKNTGDIIDRFEKRTLERFDKAEEKMDNFFDGAMKVASVLDSIGDSISDIFSKR